MKIDILVPSAGESVTEADIISWYKASGDIVEMDEPLLGLETDKASMDLTAEAEGQLEIIIPEGTVAVGDIIGKINTEAKQSESKPKTEEKTEEKTASPKEEAKEKPASQPASTDASYATGHPSPAAEKLLSENGVSPNEIVGTGKDQRITKQDVAEHLKTKSADPSSTATTQTTQTTTTTHPSSPSPQQPSGNREVRSEKMSRIRRTISERLVNAQHTAALLTTFNEIDMSAVMDIRKKYKEDFKEKYEVNLGFTSFFTKAVSKALLEFPILNASVKDNMVHYHDYCDVGIAVATPRGLVVPIIRNAETLSFREVEETVVDFAKRGRAGAITPEDMEGGTFTITNGGVFGSMLSTPIINYPQSAILGLHNIVKRPVVVNDQIEVRPIMYAAVTYDHRIIDGSDAVRFLVHIKELIEDPARLLIGL